MGGHVAFASDVVIDFSAIYPPKRLQKLWGWESHHSENPSLFMRQKIAEWCAREGARIATQLILDQSKR